MLAPKTVHELDTEIGAEGWLSRAGHPLTVTLVDGSRVEGYFYTLDPECYNLVLLQIDPLKVIIASCTIHSQLACFSDVKRVLIKAAPGKLSRNAAQPTILFSHAIATLQCKSPPLALFFNKKKKMY